MSESRKTHLEAIKAALLELKPTGATGFEGLIGVALGAFTKVPFRLAASGTQRGKDGASAVEDVGISFESKLYTGEVDRKDVVVKIADLVRNGISPDHVWVLAATTPLKTQTVDDVSADAARAGLGVVIFDWQESALPKLAVALGMGGEDVASFLKAHVTNQPVLNAALIALDALRADEDFPVVAEHILHEIDGPALGLERARESNSEWLRGALSDTGKARLRLGQPLAPADNRLHPQERQIPAALEDFYSGAPSECVTCVLGDDGCGKSWIVMQAWLSRHDAPLLLFIKPDELHDPFTASDFEKLLIRKFIQQTGDAPGGKSEARWEHRFKLWKAQGNSSAPRFVVVFDGINQRFLASWGSIISRAARLIAELGGRTALTSRTEFYQTRVRRALSVGHVDVTIPEWSAAERDKILAQRGFSSNKLHPKVAKVLLNPRILGLALELYDADEIESLEEITVSRLLFEHILKGARDEYGVNPTDFVGQLRSDAARLLDRVETQITIDRNIFDLEASAVAGGHFFHPVPGEPRRYELRDNGLTLALGFSIIERLRRVHRNGGDLAEALDLILEPISALDDTADVVLAALTVAIIDDENYAPHVAAALIKGFATLQNPSYALYPAFAVLAKRRPMAFMDAAHDLCLTGATEPNFDLVRAAILDASQSKVVWKEISEEVGNWLSTYTLSPEYTLFHRATRDSDDKIRTEREERVARIKGKLTALTPAEVAIRDRLIEVDGDVAELWRLAIQLLAGKALSPLASSLANWTFAQALNAPLNHPGDDFIDLMSLNRVDWIETRAALLPEIAPLRAENISRTGKWALLMAQRAIGSSDEGRDADAVYEVLRDERFRDLGPWRLLDKYCATDPCDPAAEKPENVADTGIKYDRIDVSKLRLHMSSASEDHFFVEARPAIARFEPSVATNKHREFAAAVAARSGLPLRQGLLELGHHTALLTSDQARRFVERWRNVGPEARRYSETHPQHENWFVFQQLLEVAFPHLTAAEQGELLLQTTIEEPVLLSIFEELKEPDQATFEGWIQNSQTGHNEHRQHMLLEIAHATGIQLSPTIRNFIAACINSPVMNVRQTAFAIIAHRKDDELLIAMARSEWSSPLNEKDANQEGWYGSIALLRAAERGVILDMDALMRISPRAYGRAAKMLKGEALSVIAARIDSSIRIAAELENRLVAPDIELEVDALDADEPSRFSVDERTSPQPQSLDAFFARFNETNAEFAERQLRNHAAFDEFWANLTKANARIILDRMFPDEFDAIVAADPELAISWADLFLNLDEGRLAAVHNLVLLVAYALADKYPEKASALLRRIRHTRPLVRFTFGRGIDLNVMAVWTGPRSKHLDALRIERLDRALNDHALSLEVFAALENGHRELLEEYVREKTSRVEPAEIARGLMVAGFGENSEFNNAALTQFVDAAGLVGHAHDAARAAYDRNCWARHWFAIMCTTPEAEEFWRASVLLLRIVDGRFPIWKDEFEQAGEPIALFGESVGDQLKSQYNKREKAREKTLFGRKTPNAIFVVTDDE